MYCTFSRHFDFWSFFKSLYLFLWIIFLFSWIGYLAFNYAHKKTICCKLICKSCIVFYCFYITVINVSFFRISRQRFGSFFFYMRLIQYSGEKKWCSLFCPSLSWGKNLSNRANKIIFLYNLEEKLLLKYIFSFA